MTMATIISPSPRILSCSSPTTQRFQFPCCSYSVSSTRISPSALHSRKSTRISAKASSNPPTVFSEDISDVLGEVSIFRATGDPVKFKQLWDQEEVI